MPADETPATTTTAVRITIESPRQPEVERLLDQSTEFAQSLYPPESNFLLSIDSLEQPEVAFYVARDAVGSALGIAALVDDGDGTAELKRMFVSAAARGHGLASRLISRIEADAAARGIRRIVLETGPLHEGALTLYRRAGYVQIPQFGQYVGEQFSVCFAKELG